MFADRIRWVLIVSAATAMLVALLVIGSGFGMSGTAVAQQTADELVEHPTGGNVPGGTLGNRSDGSFWSGIRHGAEGNVSIMDKKAGRLIQAEGDTWRNVRNGALSEYGVWGLLGIIILLALFFLIRGRIRIESGRSGETITRFKFIERVGHWTLAVSFIILGLTGLNVLYGRYVVLPVLGADAFGAISQAGKWLHNFVGFAFMIGLVMVFVMWVVHNFPNRTDLNWIAKGGGLFTKGSHPPAKKFNAGQKLIFWAVILCGVSLSLSGLALMFPFQMPLFAKTFAMLNVFGLNLPTNLGPVQDMQLSQLWHAILALVMIVVVIAHIYIGTIGMEGAFDAVKDGEVDLNWAKEHHSLWVEEVREQEKAHAQASAGSAQVPAE
ncbi:MAG: formate dehydrogenase subunit gamma [Fimbriimonadaceae bacterium]|nr:formate dehydrogenase subunit gamma [Alphaproteobacteria bacterium]